MSELKLSASGDTRGERGVGTETVPRMPRRATVSRHGAIARELTKYSNYKTWADKVRGAFAPDADGAPGVNGNGSHNGRR